MMLALALASVLAADASGAVTTWAELDTNARRVASGRIGADDEATPKPPPTTPLDLPIADGLMSVEAALLLGHEEDGLALRSDNAFGLKLFSTQTSERMIVAQSRASLVTTRLPNDFALVLQGLAKYRAQVSGARTYAFGRGDAIVERPLPSLFDLDITLRAGVSGTGFNAFDSALFSSAGGGALVGMRVGAGRERFDAFVDTTARGFPFASAPGADRRLDGTGAFVLQVTSARRLFLSGGYSVVGNISNAQGEAYVRHRLNALLGFRLPALVRCTMQANVQLTQYPDGLSIGQSYFNSIDDETQNAFEITFIRTLIANVYVKARAGFYGNELAAEGSRFSRQTAAIGIGADL